MPTDSNLIICPRCGDVNAPKALVCSICGTRLPERNESGASLPVAPEAAPQTIEETFPVEAPHEDIARDIDMRRAYHLLERAFTLAERHELEAAILACRQSLLLAPDVALGSALLALFLKRQGDIGGAANAYAKAEQLAPGNAWEQSSLASLFALFKKEESAAHAQNENMMAPLGKTEALTVTPNTAPDAAPNNHAPTLNPAKSADAESPKSVVLQETVSPARSQSWLPYAAVGTAIFIGLILLYKSFTPPAPVANNVENNSVAGEQNVVTAPPAEVALQPAPTSADSQIVAPPVPSSGQKPAAIGAATNQSTAQNASAPGQSGSQAPVVTNNQQSGEVARVNGNNAAITVAPTVAQVRQIPLPPPAGSAASPENGTQSGSAPITPRNTPAPMSYGNSRPGGPRNSIPGAFQPGRP